MTKMIISLLAFLSIASNLTANENSNEEMKKELVSHIQSGEIKEPDSETEEKVLKLISDFESCQRNINDYKKYKAEAEVMGNKIEELLSEECMSEKILEAAFSLSYFQNKYRDEILKYEGKYLQGCLGTGLRKMYFEIEDDVLKNNEKYCIVRYQIKKEPMSGLENKVINAKLVFLNEDGFELYRLHIGDIEIYTPTTGKFEIREKDYRELYTIRMLCDKIVWD